MTRPTREDWSAALEALREQDRVRLGGVPPTFEEMEAYFGGRMSDEENERMRWFLVAWPELALPWLRPFEPSELD